VRRRWIELVLLAAGAVLVPGAGQAQLPAAPRAIVAPLSNQVPSRVGAEVHDGFMPIVAVTINGKGPFRFGIDTGALGHFRITAETAAQLALPVGREVSVSDPSGRNSRTVSLHTIEELKLGNTVFRKLEGTSSIPAAVVQRQKLAGILGLDMFRDFKLTLDYANGNVRIDGERLRRGDPGVVPFTRGDGFLNVPVKIGSGEHLLHLDTGNSTAALALPEDQARMLTLTREPRSIGRARTATNMFDIFAADIDEAVSLGGVGLDIKAVSYPSPGPIGNIGSGAFRKLQVEIDQRSALVRVSKPATGNRH